MLAAILVSSSADAHVKWFSKIANCIASPLTPATVITLPLFVALFFLGGLAIAGTVFVDWRLSHRNERLARAMDWLKSHAAITAAPLLRIGVAFYFVTLPFYFQNAPIILTPELKTSAVWVPICQLLIAVSVLFRPTLALSAFGIILLYGYAIMTYGWFHMLDYPFFVGIAAFLLIDAVYGPGRHFLGFMILRLCTGFSFLWVSVEKWMYPAWVYDILKYDLQNVLMGISPYFFVMAAGFVEFCLAFLLIFGRLSSQVAAIVLLLFVVSAIPLVGMVDAIGHAPIVIVLLILATMQHRIAYPGRAAQPWSDSGDILSYVVSIPGFIGAYYLSHVLAYPGVHELVSTPTIVAVAMVLPFACRIAFTLPNVFEAVGSLLQPISLSESACNESKA